MPRKARTPPPPRRVQAPKPRAPERRPRPRWLLPAVGGGALVVAAVVLVAVFAFGSGASAADTIRDAGCNLQTYPGIGRAHVESRPRNFKYNSFPPTTGPHNGVPAELAVYSEPVDQLRILHDLEHGAVAIQYGDGVPEAAVDEIERWYQKDPNGLLVAPLPALGKQIALTAWIAPEPRPGEEAPLGQGVLAKCGSFDEEVFDAFVGEYGFRGPERFPRSALAPGTFGGQG